MNPSNQPEPNPGALDEYPYHSPLHGKSKDGIYWVPEDYQPEPNQKATNWGKNINKGLADAGQKAVPKQNSPVKERVSPTKTTNSSIPDAQAEVGRPALLPKPQPGLATTIKSQLSRAYYNGLDKKGWSLYEEQDAVDKILLEAYGKDLGVLKFIHRGMTSIDHETVQRGLKVLEEHISKLDARLQPPTAGEGESV